MQQHRSLVQRAMGLPILTALFGIGAGLALEMSGNAGASNGRSVMVGSNRNGDDAQGIGFGKPRWYEETGNGIQNRRGH